MDIHVVIDLDFLFVFEQTMKPSRILLQRTFPRYWHGQKQGVETRFVEPFSDEMARGDDRRVPAVGSFR